MRLHDVAPKDSAAPEPIIPGRRGSDRPFPLEALGPILGPVAELMVEKLQIAPGTAGQTLLGVATAVAQPLRDVPTPVGAVPISNNYVVIAASGEGKTVAKRLAMQPLQDTRNGPTIVGDTSIDGLLELLRNYGPSAALISDEAGIFLGGPAMSTSHLLRTTTSLSTICDGELPAKSRAGIQTNTVCGRRFTMVAMMQPTVAERLLGNRELMEQGFLARCMPVWVEPRTEPRGYCTDDLSKEPCFQRYVARIGELLEEEWPWATPPKKDALRPATLSLTSAAETLLKQFNRGVQDRIGGTYAHIRPVGQRIHEHVLRIAGVLTLLKDSSANAIRSSAMSNAIRLGKHYLGNAARMYTVPTPEQLHAQRMLDYLQTHFKESGHRLQDLYQYGPPPRSATHARNAIGLLIQKRWVTRESEGRGREVYRLANS